MENLAQGQSYTILRIKRKRNEEPLDALVVESSVRKKKSRGTAGMFKFAQTVEEDVWADAQRRAAIEAEISRIASQSAIVSASPPTTMVPPAPPPLSPSASRSSRDDVGRRYTVTNIPDSHQGRRVPTSPPKVLSAKDLNTNGGVKRPDFTMIDAILAQEPPAIVDDDIDNFMPMLRDYLRLQDITPAQTPAAGTPRPAQPTAASVSDDYVWDVFYHRPATLSEWAQLAGAPTLTGLPPSITDPNDSDEEEEEEDEADEDSNAEEFYRNDYPDEEEGSDSDGFFDDYEERDDEDLEWR